MRQMVHSVTGSSRVYIFDSFQKKKKEKREKKRERGKKEASASNCNMSLNRK